MQSNDPQAPATSSMETIDKDDFDAGFAAAIAASKPAEPTPIEEETPASTASTKADEKSAPAEGETTETSVNTAETTPAVPSTPEGSGDTGTESGNAAPASTPAPAERTTEAPAARKVPTEAPPVDTGAPAVDEWGFEDPVLSDEDKAILNNFEKDWSDVSAAQDKKISFELAKMETRFARALRGIISQMYSDITPIAETYSTLGRKTFRDTVLQAHSDFDTITPKLKPWIDQQPAYLQEAMMKVYNEGTAAEVIDLTRRYKEANGVKPQVPSPTPKPPVSAATVDALLPVSGKRSVVATKGSDPDDYDSAFQEAVQSLSAR